MEEKPLDKAPENLTLPLLITRGLIVFPNASEEIDASRAFSVKAIEDAKEQTNSLLFLVAQRNSKVDEPKPEDLYECGTLCRIVSYSKNGNSVRVRVVGMKRIEDEMLLEGGTFRRKKIFNAMIRYICPFFAAIIFLSSVANAFGLISM